MKKKRDKRKEEEEYEGLEVREAANDGAEGGVGARAPTEIQIGNITKSGNSIGETVVLEEIAPGEVEGLQR
jgi:hypothetical protein